jgi:hypothetical protein
MATTCTIKIEGIKFAKIYKHWDGNNPHLLKWLKNFNDKFEKERPNEVQYKFAQLLRQAYADGIIMGSEVLDSSLTTGWGVMDYNGPDGDYNYILTQDEVILQ